jgi:nucleotide-sensitive chloride channel 1A
LPNGETSSFPFFPPGEGDEDEEDDEEWEEDGDEEMNGTGRVRSDFHSGGGPGARFRPY